MSFRSRLRIAALLSIGVLATACTGQADESEAGGAAASRDRSVFAKVDPVSDIAISFSKSALFVPDERGLQDGAEVEATFKAPSLGIAAPVPIFLKVRGNTSLIEGECSFPKLSFKFKNKRDIEESAFKGLRRIKVATHCGELATTERTSYGRVANEIAPHREAFVHLVLRTIGLEAPRARPVSVTWVDTSAPTASLLVRKAAFIEDVDDVAERLGAKESYVVESEADVGAEDPASPDKMKPDEIARVHFAEALIGNDDWRLNSEPDSRWVSPEFREALSFFWNMKAVRFPDGTERPIPVDFDLSRISAPMSGPAPLPDHWAGHDQATRAQFALLMNERRRLSRPMLDATRREFVSKKDAVMKTLSTSWLDPEGKAAAKKLFENFFAIIEKDETFYLPVVSSEPELLKADGEPDDTCIANTIPAGTPIVRHGLKNAALGIEEVSLLDVGWQLPCNHDRVWVKSAELEVATDFPRQAP